MFFGLLILEYYFISGGDEPIDPGVVIVALLVDPLFPSIGLMGIPIGCM